MSRLGPCAALELSGGGFETAADCYLRAAIADPRSSAAVCGLLRLCSATLFMRHAAPPQLPRLLAVCSRHDALTHPACPVPPCPALPCRPAQIDDPLDAIAVHAGGGMWGMLGCAAFAAPNLVTDWYGAMPPSGGVVAPGAEQAQVRLGGRRQRAGQASHEWAAPGVCGELVRPGL